MLTINLHFSLSTLISLLVGILIGISIGVGLVIKSKKKNLIKNKPKSINTKLLIKNIYQYHLKTNKRYNKSFFGLIRFKRKINYQKLSKKYLNIESSNKLSLLDEIEWLITNVSLNINPDSKHPLLDLSIDDIFKLCHEVLDLAKQLFDEIGIPYLYQLKISNIIDLSSFGLKVNKVIQDKDFVSLWAILNILIRLRSLISPITWIKRGISLTLNDDLPSLLFYTMFEIIGTEAEIIYKYKVDN